MKNLQEWAKQRPIMSVEKFIEKVAWPGVRPSFVGDDGSSTTQAPQQQEPELENNQSFEATIPGVVDFSKGRLETRRDSMRLLILGQC